MKYTWIKLYNEILDDPKMGMLSDHQWRRIIEMFLFAGRAGDGGKLPPVLGMAWTLRTDEKSLRDDLNEIVKTGIITLEGDVYSVARFTQRQAGMSPAERMQRHRAGITNPVTNPVTVSLQKSNNVVTEEEEEEEVEEEEEKKKMPAASKPFPQNQNGQGAQWGEMINTGQAQSILLEAAQTAAIPMNEYPRLDTVQSMISEHGVDATAKALKQAREEWINTKGKNGKRYSPVNFGWVDWGMALLANPEFNKVEEEKPFSWEALGWK